MTEVHYRSVTMVADITHLEDTFRSIPRVSITELTPASFFAQFRRPGQPVVITGLLKTEIDWSLDSLCKILDPLVFPIRCYGRERYEQDKRTWTDIGSGVETHMMSFASFAELISQGEAQKHDLYLAKCPIEQTPLKDVSSIREVGSTLGLIGPVSAWNLWLGVGGHTTCLHYDPFDGTLVQLYGQKRLVLFPPSELYNIYPFPISAHLRHGLKLRSTYSQIYPDKPDFETFPRLKEAFQNCYEVILEPGEVLFIPATWWHEVTALGDGMVCSVNRFWNIRPVSRALRLWSKWRSHLGSLLAAPYIARNLINALLAPDRKNKLRQLLQRL